MSDSQPESTPSPSLRSETEEMLRKLDVSIDELTRKIEDGRVRDAEKERTRIKRYRALANALRTRSELVEQRELQDLHRKVQQLQRKRGEW